MQPTTLRESAELCSVTGQKQFNIATVINHDHDSESHSHHGQMARKFICVLALITMGGLLSYRLNLNSTSVGVSNDQSTKVTSSSRALPLLLQSFDTAHVRKKDKIQIQNYINGTGIILNVHITHHGGTFLCDVMKRIGPTPVFACMGGKNWPVGVPRDYESWRQPYTGRMVSQLRPHFHFVGQEYNENHQLNVLHEFDWEEPNLVSLIVMRHPIERFLSGGRCGEFHEILQDEQTTPETQGLWWDYANAECADNFALRILSANEPDCCSLQNLEAAKKLLRRFTFVVDQDCLSESVAIVGQVLKMPGFKVRRKSEEYYHFKHESARERIANDTLWEYINHKFQLDIELYEWSKTISVLECPKVLIKT